jgi:hypothetical protein
MVVKTDTKEPLKAYRQASPGTWVEIPLASATEHDCISVANPITPGFAKGWREAWYGGTKKS